METKLCPEVILHGSGFRDEFKNSIKGILDQRVMIGNIDVN